jgi:glutaminase
MSRPRPDTHEASFVSTGSLPSRELVQVLVAQAHERYRTSAEGAISGVYPALARVEPDLFGVCVAGTTGDLFSIGDSEVKFTIMSIPKPFVFALVSQAVGPEGLRPGLG